MGKEKYRLAGEVSPGRRGLEKSKSTCVVFIFARMYLCNIYLFKLNTVSETLSN